MPEDGKKLARKILRCLTVKYIVEWVYIITLHRLVPPTPYANVQSRSLPTDDYPMLCGDEFAMLYIKIREFSP